MCFGFTCDCSSQQSSTSQIYASPAEWLRKHLIPRNSVHLHKRCPTGPQEHEWLASNARETLNRLPHMQTLNDTRYRHYFGTSGVANWKRQHQTGNLQTCHTSKIIRRRGISCVLQRALRIPDPAALQQPASQRCFPATEMPPQNLHLGAWWSSPVGQAAAWSLKCLGFAA